LLSLNKVASKKTVKTYVAGNFFSVLHRLFFVNLAIGIEDEGMGFA
jgi:hypothetical protein